MIRIGMGRKENILILSSNETSSRVSSSWHADAQYIFCTKSAKIKHELCKPSREAPEERPQRAPEQQKPLSYNKINSLYYTSGTQPKWLRLSLHGLTKQPFYVCWEWVRKWNLNANQIQHSGAILKLGRQEEAVLCGAPHQLYLGTQCLTTSIKSGLCQHYSPERERERERETERERGWGWMPRLANTTWVTHTEICSNLTHEAKPVLRCFRESFSSSDVAKIFFFFFFT